MSTIDDQNNNLLQFEINNRVDPRSDRTNNSFINLDMLNENGYDSVYAIANVSGVNFNEFVVYEPERVVKWMICYPSKSLNLKNINLK